MPSAMEMLPDDTQTAIIQQNLNIREDLRIIPDAEAAGWIVTFREDHWHNPATFRRNDITVWATGRDWRKAALVNGRYASPEVFQRGLEGLRTALDLKVAA